MPISSRLTAFLVGWGVVLASTMTAGAIKAKANIGEPLWDWRPGDLIFRNGVNSLNDRLREAGGWKWASVGILRSASAGVRVMYVDENEGVLEQTFEDYVAGLSTEEYAAYREDAFVASFPDMEMLQGPLAKYAVFVAYGAPFDPQFLFGNGSFYNAELPFEAALNSGVLLGKTVTFGELAKRSESLRALFMEKMADHPYCVAVMGRDVCWGEMEGISIATTEAILSFGHLSQVFPR